MMIDTPQFCAAYGLLERSSGEVFICSSEAAFRLEGDLYQAVARLVDGSRNIDTLIQLLSPRFQGAAVVFAVERLSQAGFLEEAGPCDPRSAYWALRHGPGAERGSRPSGSSVKLINLTDLAPKPLLDLLTAEGIVLVDGQIPNPALTLVVCADYTDPRLTAINQQALVTKQPWLLLSPLGPNPKIGPLFTPESGPCQACLAHYYPPQMFDPTKAEAFSWTSSPATLQLAYALAAGAAANILAKVGNPFASNTLYVIENNLTVSTHPFAKRPQCMACGDPVAEAAKLAAIPLLRPRPFRVVTTGYRAVTPESTLAANEHLISPWTGIVRSLQPFSGFGEQGHLFQTCMALCNFTLGPQRDPLQYYQSLGKGRSVATAKAGALGEALERYATLHQGYEPQVWGSMAQLGARAIHPNLCMGFSEYQYQNRETLNQNLDKATRIPEPFQEDTKRSWTPLWSMTGKVQRLLPTRYCYLGGIADEADISSSTNGCASGNCFEEAFLQAFLELVERDATACWWYPRSARPAVDLDSFNDPWFADVRHSMASLRREVWMLDLTTDLGLPVFVALSRRTDRLQEDIILGLGAHLDPKIAATRALCELAQILPGLCPSGFDATHYPQAPARLQKWLYEATLASQPWLLPDPALAPTKYNPATLRQPESLAEACQMCIQAAAALGLETLVLNLTPPDLNLHVVRVVVPGLRHMYPRFGPGRLYSVPQKLGWTNQPLFEQTMNPYTIPF